MKPKYLDVTFVNDLNEDFSVVTGAADLKDNCTYLYILKPKGVSYNAICVSLSFSLLSKKAQQCLALVCY